MRWLVKALLGGWFLLAVGDRRKQKRGLVAAGCAGAGKPGNSMVWWIEFVANGGREVGRCCSHLGHGHGSGFEDAAVGSRRGWDLDG